MRQDLKDRLNKVADCLTKVAAIDVQKLNSSYNFLNKILGDMMAGLDNEQQDLLATARHHFDESWKAALKAGKAVEAKYVHDPLLLKRHEQEAAAKLHELSSGDAELKMRTLSKKIEELSTKRDLSVEDVKSKLNLFSKNR